MANSRLLFRIAVFLGAFLLFLGEPMAAKQLLPIFGGSAAVWMTCLVFFQVMLLAGYLYAHWITRRTQGRWPALLHASLLLAGVMLASVWAAHGMGAATASLNPATRIFLTLGLRLGLPFAVLGATSPLLQAWWARVEGQGVPYRLFAVSNAASLLALLAYPALIEPELTLRAQRIVWAAGLAIFAGVCVVLAWRAQQTSEATPVEEEGERATRWSMALWFLLPMGGAMQLSAVTGHLTNNIAAIPLLWVMPLAVYLVTFILAFQSTQLLARGVVVRLLAVMLAGLGYVLSHADVSLPIGVGVVFFLAELLLACLLLHGETYLRRPQGVRQSTLFYLLIAAGGAAGSFLIGIAAPLLFFANYDLGLAFLVTALLTTAVTWQDGRTQRLLWMTGSVLMVVLVFALRTGYGRSTILATRNFYGSLRVKHSISQGGDPVRTLLNGSIQHGTEIFSARPIKMPTTYYGEDSGAGLALRACCVGRPKRIGVIGLGVGTLAAYGLAGDRIRFYEINPAVEPIARNLFTYLRDTPARVSIADGDARSTLAAERPQNFDVLVVDAFSGDAIPLHLLTREAMGIYRRHLAPGGVLAFHVSNRYVDLEPEVGALAKAAGMEARTVRSAGNEARGEFSATWVLVAPDAQWFERTGLAESVVAGESRSNVRAWTDDYSSLVPLVRW